MPYPEYTEFGFDKSGIHTMATPIRIVYQHLLNYHYVITCISAGSVRNSGLVHWENFTYIFLSKCCPKTESLSYRLFLIIIITSGSLMECIVVCVHLPEQLTHVSNIPSLHILAGFLPKGRGLHIVESKFCLFNNSSLTSSCVHIVGENK